MKFFFSSSSSSFSTRIFLGLQRLKNAYLQTYFNGYNIYFIEILVYLPSAVNTRHYKLLKRFREDEDASTRKKKGRKTTTTKNPVHFTKSGINSNVQRSKGSGGGRATGWRILGQREVIHPLQPRADDSQSGHNQRQ